MIPVTLLDLSNITYARACWTYWLDVQLVLKRYCPPLPPHLTEARKTHKCHGKWLSISRAPTTHRICDWGSSSWWTFWWSALLKSDLTWSILVLSPRKIIFETQFSTFTTFFFTACCDRFLQVKAMISCCWYHCYILLPYSAPVNYESVPAWHSSKVFFPREFIFQIWPVPHLGRAK